MREGNKEREREVEKKFTFSIFNVYYDFQFSIFFSLSSFIIYIITNILYSYYVTLLTQFIRIINIYKFNLFSLQYYSNIY